MIRIRTASRLHFGLLSIPAAGDGQKTTLPPRHFGGAGLMIERPGIELSIAPAAQFSAAGPCADRAIAFAQGCSAALCLGQPFHVQVHDAAAEHVGLGTGTQLGLAIARGIVELTGAPRRDAVSLAPLVGRGRRSAVGIHGFDHGGLVVEAGKANPAAVAPLIGRWDFPPEWRILLILPADAKIMHGQRELDAFTALARCPCDPRNTDALSRLILLGLIPALLERDLPAFSEALYEYNRLVGTMFAPAQGGIYASAPCAAIVQAVRDFGISGVGQSSWGPAIFAVVHASESAQIRDRLGRQFPASSFIETAACNRGAEVVAEPGT